MRMGLALATLPTSSSDCIIFLMRAVNGAWFRKNLDVEDKGPSSPVPASSGIDMEAADGQGQQVQARMGAPPVVLKIAAASMCSPRPFCNRFKRTHVLLSGQSH